MTDSFSQPVKLHVAILAGGESKRFGSCKLFAKYQGQEILTHTLNTVKKVATNISMVAGAYAEQILSRQQTYGVNVFVNEQWQEGLASSVRCVNREVTPDAHLMLILADQVKLTAYDLSQLIEASNSNPEKIICSHYQGINGAPAIFPPLYRDQLNYLTGDSGAGKLLKGDHPHIYSVNIDSAEFDVDTPSDLEY